MRPLPLIGAVCCLSCERAPSSGVRGAKYRGAVVDCWAGELLGVGAEHDDVSEACVGSVVTGKGLT